MGGGPQHQFQHWQLRGARELSGGTWPKRLRMDCQSWWIRGGFVVHPWHVLAHQVFSIDVLFVLSIFVYAINIHQDSYGGNFGEALTACQSSDGMGVSWVNSSQVHAVCLEFH